MITLQQYFSDPLTGITKIYLPEHYAQATDMLRQVNALLTRLGWNYPVDPDTGTSISGERNGHGGGGYRESVEPGALRSNHKTGHAVDVYDPDNKLDDLISAYDTDLVRQNSLLEEFGLYREAPSHTPGWCHLQNLPPASRRRTFYP